MRPFPADPRENIAPHRCVGDTYQLPSKVKQYMENQCEPVLLATYLRYLTAPLAGVGQGLKAAKIYETETVGAARAPFGADAVSTEAPPAVPRDTGAQGRFGELGLSIFARCFDGMGACALPLSLLVG